jgi:integrase
VLAAAAVAAARTESTRHVYAGVWSRWERWCAGRGLAVLPGEPLAVCAYLTEQAAAGRAMGTLDLICTVIRHVHLACDLHNPADALAVRQVRRGLRRTHGSAPRRLARPLSVEEIRQIVDGIDRSTSIGIRDAAIILLGYASALRRSELVALTLADIEDKPAGLMLHIRRSKTDPEGHGQVVGVAHGQHAITDPVAALNVWREIRGAAPGRSSRASGGAPSVSRRSADMFRRGCSAPGPKSPGSTGTRITAHSMRAGHATTAALAGVPLDRIAAQTRHKDLSVLVNRYIRPLEALATTSSKDLGL